MVHALILDEGRFYYPGLSSVIAVCPAGHRRLLRIFGIQFVLDLVELLFEFLFLLNSFIKLNNSFIKFILVHQLL